MTRTENKSDRETFSGASDDPFAETNPSVSWKDMSPGDSITGTILSEAKLIQSFDIITRKPAYWESGEPKMTAVIDIELDGEPHTLWASKPSALFAALKDAQKAEGERMTPGGTLTVTFTGEEPAKQRGMNPAKQFAAKYTAS